jgi:hypothetical protein
MREFEAALASLMAEERRSAAVNHASQLTAARSTVASPPADEKPISLASSVQQNGAKPAQPAGAEQQVMLPSTIEHPQSSVKEDLLTTNVDVSDIAKSEHHVDEGIVMKCLSEGIQTDSKLMISLFDYGGQSVFDVIHHLFLTRYGVYVLVFSMEWLVNSDAITSRRCLSYLKFWLNSVVVHTLNRELETAPIVFVGTRKDSIGKPSDHQKISVILHEAFHSSSAWSSVLWNKNGVGANGHTALCPSFLLTTRLADATLR